MNTNQIERDYKTPLGISLTSMVALSVDMQQFEQAVSATKVDAAVRISSYSDAIRSNIESYEAFFASHGYKCPLNSQFERTLHDGLPTIFPSVDLLLAVEMCFGVLAGIQDFSKIRGNMRMDFASENESFEGMRSKIKCKKGEVVLRDDESVVASMFQGPDKRTKLRPTSTELLILIFSAPATSSNMIADAVQMLRRTLEPCSQKCFIQTQTL